jgi:nucleotidyltransferase substrate binding protein (TIGR01987 family)
MEKLKQCKESCVKALATLKEILTCTQPDKIVRDATIQRFEYTFETTWKLLKAFLFEVEGIDANSPKSCFREALKAGVMDEFQVEN